MKQHIAAAIGPLALGAIIMCCGALPAQSLSMKECSALYKADQTAGKLNGLSWNAYRKEKCGAQATTTTPDTKATTTTKEPAAATKAKPATATNAVFPTALSAKYSKETPAKQRMHTCLDQYKANKANNANGGLVWIQKGGGYYSECNKHLKS